MPAWSDIFELGTSAMNSREDADGFHESARYASAALARRVSNIRHLSGLPLSGWGTQHTETFVDLPPLVV